MHGKGEQPPAMAASLSSDVLTASRVAENVDPGHLGSDECSSEANLELCEQCGGLGRLIKPANAPVLAQAADCGGDASEVDAQDHHHGTMCMAQPRTNAVPRRRCCTRLE